MRRPHVLIAALILAAAGPAGIQAGRQRAPRGPAVTARIAGGTLSLSNGVLTTAWRVADRKLAFVSSGRPDGSQHTPALDQAFVLTLEDGRRIAAGDMTVAGGPRVEDAAVNARAPRAAAHVAGQQIVVPLASPAVPGPVTWRVVLREGARYWRQELTIGPVTEPFSLKSVTLIDARAPEATVMGTVQGSPLVAGDAFLGLEHPMSTCEVADGAATCTLTRTVPVARGQSLTVSAVVGLAEPGQLRRAFLAYLERERAHPYRPFLHYNSWYDLGYFTPYSEQDARSVIDAFGRELVRKRGVTLNSFLFDDGWDNHKSLWSFNDGFPNGFLPLEAEAAKFGAAPGVWMSPFGGYGAPRTERLSYGKAHRFETNARGFALSGPVYYKRFRDVCVAMITKYGVNQFKFDGVGRATGVVAGSPYGSDFEAAIHLIEELRAIKPDLFVNLTTGTWPSPFWLRYADSIWRGGEDHSFAGVGTKRQQWITYRDAQTYTNVVQGGPLYPLNALMLHGIIYARDAKDLNTDPGQDFTDEVRAYFGTGTDLQEMYITPSLLTDANWDALAEAAKWARANADVLVDTHWIGGDPGRLEVYGHAAWSPRLGIVVLRNPSDQAASFELDVAHAFELPAGAPRLYRARSPWHEDGAKPALELRAGTPVKIALKPFEVLTLDATPVGGR
jgi:hypothetical protein